MLSCLLSQFFNKNHNQYDYETFLENCSGQLAKQ